MKKIIYWALGTTVVFIAACKKDNFNQQEKELIVSGSSAPDTLAGEITVNTTVNKTTFLDGLVYVKPGVTLTVLPGVTIIGANGPIIPDTVNLRNNKGTLCVEKGGKLIANGTASQPIIWTSQQAAGSRHYGDWGGVVFYGKAPIHRANGANNGLFEAFDFKPDERNRYGGTDSLDNSGSVTYNRFEFGGGVIYQINKEVNGFTMCGVGAGTTFHHNEIAWAGDDGMEFFGGTVNIHHVLVYQPHDDNFDFDEGYHGSQQFTIAYQTANNDNSGSHFIESDNDASATNVGPHTNAFIANATFIGPTVADNSPGGSDGFYFDGGLQIRRNSRLTFVNSIIAAQKQPFLFVGSPTTGNLFSAVPSLSDSIVIAYNVIQTDDQSKAAVRSTIEGNPVPLALTNDATMVARLGSAQNALTLVNTYNDIKLDGGLKPLPGSPALIGGQNLQALGLPFFVGTPQRGAVRTNDVWTSEPWLSIANN